MKMQITSALLITLALFCFALPNTQAADGGVGNGNTAEGHGALESFTSGGFNTAIGKMRSPETPLVTATRLADHRR